MTDTALLWLAVACLAGSLAFGIAEWLVFARRRRRVLEQSRASLAAEQQAYLARLEAWIREGRP